MSVHAASGNKIRVHDPQFFVRELTQRAPGRKMVTSNRVFIVCPYHKDTQPSGSISIDLSKPGLLGQYRCWGCGTVKTWNEIATDLGMTVVDSNQKTPSKVPKYDLSELKQQMLGARAKYNGTYVAPTKFKSEEYGVAADSDDPLTLFDLAEDWRRFKCDFLKSLGAKLAYHDASGYFYLRFPVLVRGKEVGYFRAQVKKVKNFPSYLNAPGEWSKRFGLFLYDQSVALAKRLEVSTIVVVEGPRDALRLYRDGIPAVAILGTKSWSNSKRALLETQFKRVILMLDGDDAGKKATQEILDSFRNRVTIRDVKLWEEAERLGLKKLDPFKAKKRIIERVRRML